MRFPWQRRARNDRLVLACSDDRFVYVHAQDDRVLRCGVEHRGDDAPPAFAKRVRGLGLPSRNATAVLALADCQLLQIEAPTVPPDELKAAARWRIKDMVDAHLDDLTLDVMAVGDGRGKAPKQLFVAAAQSRAVRDATKLAHQAGIELAVIDIHETAQRNLQTAHAGKRGRADRAHAALMPYGAQCLLTICAGGELYYARRLDWQPAQLADRGEGTGVVAAGSPTALEFADADFIDYGADDASSGASDGDAPPLVIELQRSIDVWERSHPELPLDQLVVHAETADLVVLVARLRAAVAVPVAVLEPDTLFSGLEAVPAATLAQVLPLLGALRRVESRPF
jgi:MSHA biogenesis protein MshI